MTEPTVTMIFATNISTVWPVVEPILRPAIEKGATHNSEDVRKSLMGGLSQLWVQYTDGLIEAAVVTEFVPYPKCVFLRVWLLGALDNATVLWKELEEFVTDFAKVNSCAGIECIGREGWGKKFKYLVKSATIYRAFLKE